MTQIPNNTLSAIFRRLNEYLKNKGIENAHSLRKVDKVNLYCQLENKPIPSTKKLMNSFLFNEYKNSSSKISSLIKTQSAKTKKKVYNERKIEYADYINSQKWKTFRLSIIKQRGYKCEKCGADDKIIHAHHLTYERFMNELPEDIQLLCIVCHKNHHKKERKEKSKKLSKAKRKIEKHNLNVKEISITSRDVMLQKRYNELKVKGIII